MPRTGDQYFPFKQNPDLFYLTGIEQPKSMLCLCPNNPDATLREILFLEKSNEHYQTWTGSKLSSEMATEISGIKNIVWLDSLEQTLNKILKYARHIYLPLHEADRTHDEVPTRDLRFAQYLREQYPVHSFEMLNPLLIELRTIKEPEEIELIKHACNITASAFIEVIKILKPNIYEYEIEANLTYQFLNRQATGHAFHPIVASGKNACVLHYANNNCICNNNELLLIDFGAEYKNYNADVTRVLPINGKFNNRQLQVYNAVLRLVKLAPKLIKATRTIEEIHLELCKEAEKEMIGLGLFTNDDVLKQNPEKPIFKKYFMHGVSHYLGLDVHDVGNKTDTLMPGNIITWEPGIYIPDENIGIRLENDILVTDSGIINLTAQIPIEVDDIENIMTQ